MKKLAWTVPLLFLLYLSWHGFSLFTKLNPAFKAPVSLPDFLIQQIDNDLKNGQISKEDLEITWAQCTQRSDSAVFIRYKLVDGQFSVNARDAIRRDRRFIVLTEVFQKLFKEREFSNLDFIVFLDDLLEENPYPAPILAFSAKAGAQKIVLIPDASALDLGDRTYITSAILKAGKKYDWTRKKEIVFWRGSPTSMAPIMEEIEKDDWRRSPRFQLVKFSQRHPQAVNAGFIAKYTIPGEAQSLLNSIFSVLPTVHPKNHLAYKYLIDVDGCSCPFSRTFWILLSNSLMLKQVTDNKQWFYSGLKPYEHFVPLKSDLGDLIEKIEWCKANDPAVQKIAQNGTAFALDYLQYDQNIQFLSELLTQYAKQMQFTPNFEKEDIIESKISLTAKMKYIIKGFLRKRMNKPIT